VAKAKALAHGHTRGGKLVLYVPTRVGAPEAAQVIKQNLKRVGLDVEVKTFPLTGYFDRLANPAEPFDMAWYGLGVSLPDPGLVLNDLFDGRSIGKSDNFNLSYFNSPKWNRALRRASLLTGARRSRAFGRLDVQIARDAAPTVALYVNSALTLVSARTGCVVVNPDLDLDAVCVE
jgi:ABC-type transport system substrate-binding protein